VSDKFNEGKNMSDYSKEDLFRDMEALRRIGLIEVIGVNDEGEWLWGATEKSMKMTEEERTELIYKSFGEEE
jgi:hypothetical protein